MKLISLVTTFFIIGMASAFCAEVEIVGIDIPGLHQKDGGGVYDQIIDKAAVKAGLAKLTVLPPARAEGFFDQCENCCFSPANKNPEFYSYKGDVSITAPMNTAKIYVFTAHGSATINNIEGLQGKKVGIRHGMPYGKSFDNAGLSTEASKTIESNIKKLEKGRIDAFVAYVPDAYAAFSKLNIEPYPHDKANPIAIHPDSLVCRGVSDDFNNSFNENLQKMLESGDLKKILGDSYVDP